MFNDTITIEDTPTLITSGGMSITPNAVLIHVPQGGATVYLGNENVDVADGFPVTAGAYIGWDLVTEPLYGIVASGTQDVKMLARSAG